MNNIANFFQELSDKLVSIEAKLENLQLQTEKSEEKPVSGSELCSYLGISQPTLIARRKKGQIPYRKIGKRYLYLKSEVLSKISK